MSTAVTTRGRRRGAVLALGIAASLGVAALAAPAQAAEPGEAVHGGTLVWKVSDELAAFTGSVTLEGGAARDASSGAVSFVDGEGTVDPATGAGDVQYHGTYTIADAPNPMAPDQDYYSVTITDPRVEVSADGTGAIYASVGSWVADPDGGPGTTDSPTLNTKVVGLSDTAFVVSGTAVSLTATPDWAGVVPAGSSEAEGLGIPDGQPVDGQSFAPEFLGAINLGIRAHFYASGSDYDARKAPAPVTVVPAPRVTVSTAPSATGTLVTVEGTDFTPAVLPGDAGVYVAIAPSGGLPDVSSQAGMANFLKEIDYVTPGRLAAGSFTSALDVPDAEPVPGVSYSVYTWQAHTHSNVSQDTETSLGVLVAAAVPPAAPVVSTDLGAKAKVRAGGSVRLSVVASGEGLSYRWQRARKGKAFVDVKGATSSSLVVTPKKTKASGNQYRVVVSNAGGSVTSAVTTLKVKKAKAKVTRARLSRTKVAAHAKKKARARVKVTVKAKGVTVRGKVRVVFDKKHAGKKATRKVTAKLRKAKGKAKVTVRAPRLKRGKYTVTVRYQGKKHVITKAKKKAGVLKVTR